MKKKEIERTRRKWRNVVNSYVILTTCIAMLCYMIMVCIRQEQLRSIENLPVQDFGSSLPSPQSSFPSQYLSIGKHFVGTRHANSDTLQHCTSIVADTNKMNSNDKTLCSCLSIWKMFSKMHKNKMYTKLLLLLKNIVWSMGLSIYCQR